VGCEGGSLEAAPARHTHPYWGLKLIRQKDKTRHTASLAATTTARVTGAESSPALPDLGLPTKWAKES